MADLETAEEAAEDSCCSPLGSGSEADYYASASDTDSGGSEQEIYSNPSDAWSPGLSARQEDNNNTTSHITDDVRDESHVSQEVKVTPSTPCTELPSKTNAKESLLSEIRENYEQTPSEHLDIASQQKTCAQRTITPYDTQV